VRRAIKIGLLILLACRPLAVLAGAVVDGIAATVNNFPILRSDVEEGLAFEALASGRPIGSWTESERREELDRLIDQQLLRLQMQAPDLAPPSREQLDQRIEEVRKLHPGAQSDEGWQRLMDEYGLTLPRVEELVVNQMLVFRLVDTRLRPGVQPDPRRIETYYRETLLPQLAAKGAKPPTLAEVTPQIKAILIEKEISEQLASWLQTLRLENNVNKIENGQPKSIEAEEK
jgi:hypothetical protein